MTTLSKAFASSTRSFHALAIGSILLWSGCDTDSETNTETGTNADDTNLGSGPRCEPIPTPLASLEAVTDTGLSGAQLLTRVQGQHSFQWQRDNTPSFIPYTLVPDTQLLDLSLDVRYEGGAIRHIRSQYVPCTSMICPDIAVYCVDSIELDTTLYLKSADSTINTAWPVTLTMYDPADPDFLQLESEQNESGTPKILLNYKLPAEAQPGSFHISSITFPESSTMQTYGLVFGAEFSASELSHSSLSLQMSFVDGEVAQAGGFPVYSEFPEQ